ncbi:MAG: hypothetical protein P0Y53_09310 [Candidatus Pseudobacter hemicellulosilyticus]|uniref:Uncharacterized protein n=1 Tax=Candidatus Pseudobacter hemicellulosilyticus TaxID=3121375 RepID=A0AAJ6BJ95_9BACT|nr:MAG: hypothetical protein P0Y53_09310 [Pseudobacter sp.]
MHYWGQDEDDHDDERDRQLPYKDLDAHTIQHHFVPLEKRLAIRPHTPQEPSIDYPVIKDDNLPTPALSSLFRPPKA